MEINIILENMLLNIFKFYILKYIIKIEKNLPFLMYFKIYSLYISIYSLLYIVYYIFDEIERK